jgi:hypothetical protein
MYLLSICQRSFAAAAGGPRKLALAAMLGKTLLLVTRAGDGGRSASHGTGPIASGSPPSTSPSTTIATRAASVPVSCHSPGCQ